eukprot:8229413-Lingulodinium_polyedra.AAC.1
MRSEARPEGLPSLASTDADRVALASRLILFFVRVARILDAAGGAFVLENPKRSYIWDLEEVRGFAGSSGWARTEYAACALGGARA